MNPIMSKTPHLVRWLWWLPVAWLGWHVLDWAVLQATFRPDLAACRAVGDWRLTGCAVGITMRFTPRTRAST